MLKVAHRHRRSQAQSLEQRHVLAGRAEGEGKGPKHGIAGADISAITLIRSRPVPLAQLTTCLALGKYAASWVFSSAVTFRTVC